MNCTYVNVATLPREAIDARVEELFSWPVDADDALYGDPRCGCSEDCLWDSPLDLEAL